METKQIEYHMNHPIEMELLIKLYKSVGWSAYTNCSNTMQNILSGSLFHISAWEGERLAGLVRVVGDGCSILYIQDLLVHPDYQRKGIGSSLVRRVLERAKSIRQIILTTDGTERNLHFYRSVGFVPVAVTGAVSLIKNEE